PDVISSYSCHGSLIQREMISKFMTLEGFVKGPRVLDVDDAIFLHRDGSAARGIAKKCDAIVCGNNYLAAWFSQHCSNVFVVPTPINTNVYHPGNACAHD